MSSTSMGLKLPLWMEVARRPASADPCKAANSAYKVAPQNAIILDPGSLERLFNVTELVGKEVIAVICSGH